MTSERGVLFDLDSTLIDSSQAVMGAWFQLADEAGFHRELLRDLHGIPAEGCLRIVMPDADDHTISHWTKRAETLEVEHKAEIFPIAGALDLLDHLASQEIPWAIVTSCTAPLAAVRIQAAGLPAPHALVTFSDVKNGKPHPEPFLLGATRIKVAPENCWVVEDAHSGTTAGKAAGCKVAGVLTTNPREKLPNADHYLEHLMDLVPLLDL